MAVSSDLGVRPAEQIVAEMEEHSVRGLLVEGCLQALPLYWNQVDKGRERVTCSDAKEY